MRKWKWLLVITGATILGAWYFLFCKMYDPQSISGNADMLLAIDVKKNTNSILYYYITTPSEWSFDRIFSSRKKGREPGWKDAIKIPDYLFVFHIKDQPVDALYCRLTIKNENDFQKVLAAYGFKERLKQNGLAEYYSDQLGIDVIKNNDQLLVGNHAVKDKLLLRSVATDLFNKKDFMQETDVQKIINLSNHFTIYIQKNNFLKEDVLLNGHFTNGGLRLEALAEPAKQFTFEEAEFDTRDSSLANLAFTQPAPEVYALIPVSLKSKLATAFNFNIDSLFLPGNNKYALDIAAIKTRTDAAVSYSYDDDFNKVENIVINKIQEPSFNFMMLGQDPSLVFNYWVSNKSIKADASGFLFTPVPFVKTYVAVNKKDTLLITSSNYDHLKADGPVTCIANLHVNTGRLPANSASLLPDIFGPVIKNIASFNLTAKKEKANLKVELIVTAKNKNKPFLLCFE